jgi:putative heme-binding domain-containing protein
MSPSSIASIDSSFCKRYNPISQILLGLMTACLLASCNKKTPDQTSFASLIDTTVSVYGPYVALKLPIKAGVKISNPIQLEPGPGGVLYAANATGEVYSLQDTDGDGFEDTNVLYCDVKEFGLRSPGGFAFRGDTIYIGTAQQVRAFLDVDKDGKADTSWVYFDDIPTSEHPYEWTSGLTFGPDGSLYCAITTDSWNAGASPDPKGYRGSILKIAPGGKKAEVVATGIRSVYGMTFTPDNESFYFIDNEGGGNPNEELNLLVPNAFYGHNQKKYSFETVTGPVLELQTDFAPSDLAFNSSENDFGGTAGNLFISFYGPGERWNRGSIGRIVFVKKNDGSIGYEEHPVADIPKLSNLAFGKDGSLYLAQHGKADYWYNAIYENEGHFYKLVHDPSLANRSPKPRIVLTSLSESSVDKGRELFGLYGCGGCHAVDGGAELLGPNLDVIGKQLSREELLEEIMKPSERIKPSMMATRIIKKDGKVLLGRVVNANENEISLMLVGNNIVQIPKSEISETINEKKSLMYEGLVNAMNDADRESLLDYIVSLSK